MAAVVRVEQRWEERSDRTTRSEDEEWRGGKNGEVGEQQRSEGRAPTWEKTVDVEKAAIAAQPGRDLCNAGEEGPRSRHREARSE